MKLYTNELRYGSWIDYLGKHVQCDISTIYAYSKTVGETGMYKPIPVTSDILLKCGFENLHTEHCESFRLKPLLIEMLPDTDIMIRIELGIENYAYVLIKDRFYALHELQNLYFPLTGQELIYTP